MSLKSKYKELVPFKLRTRIHSVLKSGVWHPVNDNILQSYLTQQKTGSLFIHIPKTGGISLYSSIYKSDSYGHIKYSEYQNIIPQKELNQLFKFCIVRHPIERFISGYSYLRSGGRKKPLDLKYRDYISQATDINDFIINFLSPDNLNEFQHFIPQAEFIESKDGSIELDFIGRQENLLADFEYIKSKVKSKAISLSSKNQSSHDQTVLTQKSLDKLMLFYKKDFQILNYH